jgi:hypothetical protein
MKLPEEVREAAWTVRPGRERAEEARLVIG